MPLLPTLNTERLRLRPFALEDGPVVQRLAGAWELADTTANLPHPYEDGMAEQWIAGHAEACKGGEGLTLAVTLPAGDELVGAIGLILDQGYKGELGYWIGRPYWARGYCTEAALAVVNYGFEELHLARIFARALARNPASARVLQKIGMRHEGTQRQHVLKWGKPEDVELFGLLRADHPPPGG